MQTRRSRPNLARRLRVGIGQAKGLSLQAEQQFEKNLVGRFEKLNPVRRFVAGWVGLLILLLIGLVIQTLALSGYYQTLESVPGGIYNEGVLGRFTNANPLYATSDADASVSHLIFAGLLKYDGQGELAGDLASSFRADDHGVVYTVHLRPNLKWQDGQPLTSSDVVFTYNLIQNADAQSPLRDSWQGIKVAAPDDHTVIFTLPGTLASFPYNLTNGIVPEHLLAKIPPSDLRSANFNTVNPVGAGPFAWHGIHVSAASNPDNIQEQIALTPFADYAGGKPKLDQFIVRTYVSQSQLIAALNSGQLTAVEGLDALPQAVAKKTAIVQHNLTLQAANMVFFKTTQPPLNDKTVRHALVQATNVPSVIRHLSYPARIVNEPLLVGQIGYDASLAQPKYDPRGAQAALAGAGWTVNKDGVLQKNGQLLAFSLSAADTPDNHVVAGQLQSQWRRLGVRLSVDYLDSVDFQNALNYHDYDAVLNGISIGQDPDVFVYWDSSQADIRSANRLNLSEYNNPTADASLEAGRSRLDPAIRSAKYKSFLQAWQQDSPALGLYQPRSLYLTDGLVSGLKDGPVNSPLGRYNNVVNWEIRQAKVTD